jgi:ABC-type transporter Mla maintaining outer membrane lipid asymmetry ATPase subunit MlaF
MLQIDEGHADSMEQAAIATNAKSRLELTALKAEQPQQHIQELDGGIAKRNLIPAAPASAA